MIELGIDCTLIYRPRTETSTLSTVYQRNRKTNDVMELNTNHCCTTRATRSELVAALSDLEHALH